MRAILLGLALLFSFAGCDEPQRRSPPPASPIAPIDLNTATEKQLEAMPAIGPKHARSIIASRNARGGRFKSIDELLEIDGIGPKTVDAIRLYVFVSP
jgi:competence protein ComEA